jgi:hypothetical protein
VYRTRYFVRVEVCSWCVPTYYKPNTDESRKVEAPPAPAAPRSVLPPSLALRGRRGLSSSRSRRAPRTTHTNDSISIKKRAPYGCIGIRRRFGCLDARGTNASPASHCPPPARVPRRRGLTRLHRPSTGVDRERVELDCWRANGTKASSAGGRGAFFDSARGE